MSVISYGVILYSKIDEWSDEYEMNHILNGGYQMKWSHDPRSYERKFSNCSEKPEKFKTLTVLEPVTSPCWGDALINGAVRPQMVRTGRLRVQSYPWWMNQRTKWSAELQRAKRSSEAPLVSKIGSLSRKFDYDVILWTSFVGTDSWKGGRGVSMSPSISCVFD